MEESDVGAISRGIGAATAILVLGFLGSRLSGLARDVVIGSLFGTSPQLDAYFAAFRLPDLIFQLLAGAALSSAFLPTFGGLLQRGETGDAWLLASSVFNLALIATLTCSLATMAAAPWLVPLYVPGFSAQQQALTVELVQIMLVSPVFFSISGITMAILNARRRFALPSLAPVVYNLAIIGAALGLNALCGVRALAAGVCAGALLHLLVQMPGLFQVQMAYRWVLSLGHPAVREVGRLLLPRVFGLAAVQLNLMVTTLLASTLAPGSLAALNYAWVVMMMPLGIFGIAVAMAIFPALVDLGATEQWHVLGRGVSSALRLVLFFTIPASLGLILLRQPLVALLFQRGLFHRCSTDATAWALMFYAIGLSGHAVIEVLSRAFYALRDTKTPVQWGVIAMGLTLILSLTLMRPLGHGGLALSLSLATIAEAGALLLMLGRRLPRLGRQDFVPFALKTALASCLMAAVVEGFLLWCPVDSGSFGGLLLLVLCGIVLGASAYLGLAYALDMKEIEVLLRRRAVLEG